MPHSETIDCYPAACLSSKQSEEKENTAMGTTNPQESDGRERPMNRTVPQSAIDFECPCCKRQLFWMWTVAVRDEKLDRFKCQACSIKVVVSHSFDDLAIAAVAARETSPDEQGSESR